MTTTEGRRKPVNAWYTVANGLQDGLDLSPHLLANESRERHEHVDDKGHPARPRSSSIWPQYSLEYSVLATACLSPPNLQTLLDRRVEKLQAIQSVTRQGSTDTRGDVAKRVCQRPFLGPSPVGVHVRMDIVCRVRCGFCWLRDYGH